MPLALEQGRGRNGLERSMTIKMYPIEFEATDETDEALFKVRCFDEATSSVEIQTLVTPQTWLEIAEKIHDALMLIHPEADK
jgi:hypothetical protein